MTKNLFDTTEKMGFGRSFLLQKYRKKTLNNINECKQHIHKHIDSLALYIHTPTGCCVSLAFCYHSI